MTLHPCHRCHRCGKLPTTFIHDGGGTVRIHMPVYGMVGLYIECPYCKASTRVYSPVEAIFDEGSTRSATPYTFEAITQALRLAVEEWNQIGESRKGDTNA